MSIQFTKVSRTLHNREVRWLMHEIDWKGVKTDLTPLLLASRLGIDILVELLLVGEAKVDLKDPKSGRTPLLWAAKGGHEGIVKLLLEAKAKRYKDIFKLFRSFNSK
jgi:ankyrin repeat protein